MPCKGLYLKSTGAVVWQQREWQGYSPGTMNLTDRALSALDATLRSLFVTPHASRAMPVPAVGPAETLAPDERELSAGLMRVNHVGEVCAQALYQAQGLTARTPALRQQMMEAAREETDHLAWTAQRLKELNARPSLLNPVWYAGAFGLGLLAGRMGDAISLGFVVETERQVEQHLAGHLERLPANDLRSRTIVAQMKDDERRHGDAAERAGARPLPAAARFAMRAAAKLMTVTAQRV
jgi:3-demethoxyubiquinol 3-hydroxylase